MDGLTRISNAFSSAKKEGRAAFMPYLTLGYPEPMLSISLVEAAANAGADLIELGVPFSDPLADGPTIQHSTQVALSQGMTVKKCIEFVEKIRCRGVTQPLLMMGYYNPILAYGLEKYINDIVQAGADGCIIPDLPIDEALELETLCGQQQAALVYLASPNTQPDRLALLARRTSGFLYLVSVTGVTGARCGLPQDLEAFISRARAVSSCPVAVGFGIATPEQASAVGKMADGVIIGSAMVKAIDENKKDPVQSVMRYTSQISQALKK